MLKDNLNLAYKNIRERMSRSILTLLGISIGIMAIISLMAIGEGMNQAVTGELSSLSDTILVQVGDGFSIFSMRSGSSVNGDGGEYLTERDINNIKRIQGIKEVNTQLSGSGIISYNGEDTVVSLTGMAVEAMDTRYVSEELESGFLLQNGDQNKIIIGYDVAHEYFDAEISVGSRIKINGEKFFVNGIFSMQGAGGFISTDDIVLLTSWDFEKLTGESNVQSALVTVYDVNYVESIADEIEQVINKNHGEDDFASATSMSSILESIQNIIGIIQMM
ncbi:ABC-type transport system, involved in lipoprotein release, permease component, partial [Thermoplasmatales archaeon SCGC AB-539-N05]